MSVKQNLPEFGVSIYFPDELNELDKTGQFCHIELPGEMIDAANVGILKKISRTYSLSVRDICTRKILQELPDVPFGVKQDFYRYFYSKCEIMEECGISRLAMAVDVERALADSFYAANLTEIRHCCFGMAERRNIEIALELRIPGMDDEKVSGFLDFRKNLLYPVKILIDFHLHEPDGFKRLEESADKLKFDRERWRFSFEAASGNYLSSEIVRRVLPFVSGDMRDGGSVILAPGAGAEDGIILSLDAGVREILEIKTEQE